MEREKIKEILEGLDDSYLEVWQDDNKIVCTSCASDWAKMLLIDDLTVINCDSCGKRIFSQNTAMAATKKLEEEIRKQKERKREQKEERRKLRKKIFLMYLRRPWLLIYLGLKRE